MAVIVHSSTTTGILATASGDTYVTLVDRFVSNTVDAVDFQDFDNIEYFVHGAVIAGDDGIVSSGAANNIDVAISASGSVMGGGDGIQFFGPGSDTFGNSVINHGSIVGQSGEGVDFRSNGSIIVNTGTIWGDSIAIFMSGDSNEAMNAGIVASNASGIQITGDSARITNSGEVTVQGFHGLFVVGINGIIENDGLVTARDTGIDMTGDNGSITNTGRIIGEIGISVMTTTNAVAAPIDIANHGIVQGRSVGVQLQAGETGDRLTLTNSGTISVSNLDGLAIQGSSTTDIIRNTGLIDGDVDLGDGNDAFRSGAGLISGTIDGGTGNDTIGGGAEDNRIEGGGGADLIYGGAGDDSLSSNWGGDTIFGGDGDDTIDAGNGYDLAWGGAGHDRIDMGSGQDTAHGGAGDDTIRAGGDGGDVLFGDAGDDVIVSTGAGGDQIHGGLGNDTMTGGDGKDTFHFNKAAGHDVITDFADGEDSLDLTVFGTGFAAMNAAGAFSEGVGGTVIDLGVIGAEGSITLLGFALSDLGGADFAF
ncbi:calcium-binding protein [Mesobacterium pallidum]|uniref:calcium-binding protein n=1 Tax=Mesobacterium pallidum TaxID=2872037 RepID=UPI001EE200DC|nr:calcium-binding protein [Mesobacterium pallidum]